jgi:hypothetical protein
MKIWNLKLVVAAASIGFFLSSCTGDGTTIDPTALAPAVSLETGTGIISADATVEPGAEFTVSVKGTKTDADMNTLTVEEAGVKVDIARVNIAANPLLLSGTERTSFTKSVKIKAHTTIGEKTYSFVVTDADGVKGTKSIKIKTNGTPPVVKLAIAGTDNVTIPAGTTYVTAWDVKKGTSKLKTVEVLLNDVKVTDLSTLTYGSPIGTAFTANPQAIAAADQDAFAQKIQVKIPAAPGVYKYTFVFTDESGLQNSQVVTITGGTPIITIPGILLNQAGPTGTGGLDLDLGQGTGSADPNAEIRDMGINANSPATNWKQLIAGVNGSEIRAIKKGSNGVPETFSFDNITLKEEITALFDKGVAFTAMDGTIKVSDKVANGDVFAVKNGSKVYLLLTKNVKIAPAAADNSDSYTFDVKK